MQIIEEKVYEDTKPLQEDKAKVDVKVTQVDLEIEELEALLEKKRLEREALLIER